MRIQSAARGAMAATSCPQMVQKVMYGKAAKLNSVDSLGSLLSRSIASLPLSSRSTFGLKRQAERRAPFVKSSKFFGTSISLNPYQEFTQSLIHHPVAVRHGRSVRHGRVRLTDTGIPLENDAALLATISSEASRASAITNQLSPASRIELQSSLLTGGTIIPPSVLVECLEVSRCEELSGHVRISGAKNSALAVLAGALCSEEPLILRMVPDLHDIRRMCQVLESVGVKIKRDVDGPSSISVDASHLTSVEPCAEAVRKLRASFFVIGALMGRQGEAVVPLPGGCNIGARPINIHVRGLEALGAEVDIRQGRVHARALSGKRLKGGNYCLDFPSVGATETLMMAASLAEGETTLSNVAQEPEVVDLADFLISCGANIRGAGTNTLTIMGVEKLHGSDFTVIPDRIEAGTFLVAAAITRSSISMSPVMPKHLTSVISKLRSLGCRITQTNPDKLQISTIGAHLGGCDLTTLPYPGFPTDLQPQLMSLLTCCSGQSIIKETVFESRMRHVEELQKMGAEIKVTGDTAIVSGRMNGRALYGVPVTATDLRAGAALVLAGMAAEGVTHIEGVNHIDRGYEKFDDKLRGLGANIQRLPCLPAELNM